MTSVDHIECDDGYALAVRRWTPTDDVKAQLIILHGVVSHSEWLKPFGIRLAKVGIEVICPDRRGTGLNQLAPGDAPDKSTLVSDIHATARQLHRPDCTPHLAGFCWGAVYAICCAETDQDDWASLILAAPSVFPSQDMLEQTLVCGESKVATEKPLVPIDRFTSGPAYRSYIIPDPLRTRSVSPRFNSIMRDMSTLLTPRWARLMLPTLMLLANDDRLVDNEKHAVAFNRLRATSKQLMTIDGEHGLQFDAPDDTCDAIAKWIHPIR